MPINMMRAILIFLSVFMVPVDAAVYKCKTADGATSYSNKPCPGAKKMRTTKKVRTTTNASQNDCKKIRDLAEAVAEKMRVGLSSDQVIAEAGGVDALDGISLDIISYVYSFQNTDTTAQRITALSTTRCENRSSQAKNSTVKINKPRRGDEFRRGDKIPCVLKYLKHERVSDRVLFKGTVDNPAAKWIDLRVFDRANRGQFMGVARGAVVNKTFEAYLDDATVSDPRVEPDCEI